MRTLRQFGVIAAAGAATLMTASAVQAAPASYQTAVQLNNPYVFYRLGESSGTTADDASPNNRDGTYVNAPTVGLAGQGVLSDTAVQFNGTSQYVSAPINSFGTSVPNSTYEFILKANTANFTTQGSIFGVINAADSGAGIHDKQAVGIEVNSAGVNGTTTAGTSRLWLRDDDGSQLWANFDNDNLLDGNYHHLVITVDMNPLNTTVSDKVKVYIDGLAQTLTAGAESAALADNWKAFTVPGYFAARDVRSTTVDKYAPVTIDEAVLYSSTLSATQVAVNATAAGFVVPEPASLGLLGVASLFALRRRTRRA